jgi:hypothetical protein
MTIDRMSSRARPARATLLAAVLPAVLVAALAGCHSGGARAAATTSPSAMSDDRILAIGREYSQCVRDHGVPNFPDLVLNDGMLVLPEDNTADSSKQALQANKAAQDACKSILDKLPASAQKNRPPTAADVQNMLKFSQCMREHGVPEWPDPSNDGVFPILGTPLETEGKSARMVTAMQACRQYWDKGLRVK